MNPFNDIVVLGKVDQETKATRPGAFSDPSPTIDCIGFTRDTNPCD